MAEVDVSNTNLTDPPRGSLPFLEVTCKSSGKTRRFSVGTKAGFALQLINRKLDVGVLPGSYIEAIKEGEEEEPVSFGPSSVLVDYGVGWRLQTVVDEGFEKEKERPATITQFTSVKRPDGPDQAKESRLESKVQSNGLYMGRILLAFILIFLLGGIFTWGLENLPRIILYVTSLL